MENAQTSMVATASREVSEDHKNSIVAFLVEEARLLDEHRFDEWEKRLDDDMFYLIPIQPGEFDPSRHVAVVADNRKRLSNRIKQLKTGMRYAQDPPSVMRRLISNVEIECRGEDEFAVSSNFSLFEFRVQSGNEVYVWAGRCSHILKIRQGTVSVAKKRVDLINISGPIPTLAFLL